MPKVTEGGASNAWETPLECSRCGAQVALTAPACPECRSTVFVVPGAPQGEPEPDYSGSGFAALGTTADLDGGAPEPEETAAEPPPAVAAPPLPPRTPPRRAE